jgi:hypothetical protein
VLGWTSRSRAWAHFVIATIAALAAEDEAAHLARFSQTERGGRRRDDVVNSSWQILVNQTLLFFMT